MPRVANPMHNETQQWDNAAKSIGAALFGDPEARAMWELKNAQTENQMQQGIGESITNSNRMQLGSVFEDAYTPMGEDGQRAPATKEQFRMAIPKVMATMAGAEMAGDADEALNNWSAYSDDPAFQTQGLVARGLMPDENFAPSPQRADQISARDAAEDTTQAVTLEGVKPRTVEQKMGDVFDQFTPEQKVAMTAGKVNSDTTVKNVMLPDGSRTTAIGNTYVDAAGNSQPLPFGSQVYGVESTGEEGGGALGMTKSTQNDVQKRKLELDRFKNTIDLFRAAGEDEQNYGLAGMTRSTLQNAIGQGNAIAAALGNTAKDAQTRILAAGAADDGSFVSPDYFDANLPYLEVLRNTMAYQYATAIAGNDRISDSDFRVALDVVGDPFSIMGNKNDTMARLGLFEQMYESENAKLEGAIQTGQVPGMPQASMGDQLFGGAPAAQAAPVQEEWVEGDVVENKATGERRQLVNGQWVPVSGGP